MSNKQFIAPKNASSAYIYVNVREKPNIDSKSIYRLEGTGKIAKLLKEEGDSNFIFSQYQFENGIVGWIRNDVHVRTEFEDGFINVPYVSQSDVYSDKFINDCGIACVCMLAKFKGKECKVNDIAAKVGMSKYSLTSFQHILKAGNLLGISLRFERPFDLVDGINYIKKGLPYIALVNYNEIDKKYNFPHFIVVNGIDDDMFDILDPYNSNNRKLSSPILANAISKTETQKNMPFQAILLE